MITLIFILLSSAQIDETFECRPAAVIRDRVNEYCIQASQVSVDYKKPQLRKIKNGELFFTSVDDQHGNVTLKMAHKCRGEKISEWKTFDSFCGYANMEFDRQTPDIKEIRADIAKTHKLNEQRNRNQIDRLVAQQMNPWIADPQKNIFVKDGKVFITVLKSMMGFTCHTPQELAYETNCK